MRYFYSFIFFLFFVLESAEGQAARPSASTTVRTPSSTSAPSATQPTISASAAAQPTANATLITIRASSDGDGSLQDRATNCTNASKKLVSGKCAIQTLEFP